MKANWEGIEIIFCVDSVSRNFISHSNVVIISLYLEIFFLD